MDKSGRRFRYALRWAGISAAGLLLAGCVFAALFPFLIDAAAIRGALAGKLSAWSGGPVSIGGALRIGSFAGLSVEASAVDIVARPGQGPIRLTRAKSVKASVSLSSLFRGKIDFKKFVIDSPHVVFRRGFPEPLRPSYGLATAQMALALAAGSPFADVELVDPVFFFSASANGAYERAGLSRVKLSKKPAFSVSTGVFVANASGADNAFYALDLAGRDFGASFRGECGGGCQTAFGAFRLSAALDAGTGRTILSALAPWERPGTIALSGELTLSRRRAALDDAALSFGDHAAKGSLALDVTGDRPRLEGTVAYDTLDVTPRFTANGGKPPPRLSFETLPLVLADADRPLDFDLRLSADRFRVASFETGPLALALTRIENRTSIDIASVALFGGHATGTLDIDPDAAAPVSLRGNGAQLDASALASAFQLPLGIKGPIALQANLAMPAVQDARGGTGSFSIRFPLGGSLEGEVAETLGAALHKQDLSWGLRGSSFPFTVATIEGIVNPGSIDLTVQGRSGEKGIDGSLKIAIPGAEVTGTLLASENATLGDPESGNAPAQAENATKLRVSGTADALIVSAAREPSLSN